MRFLFRLLRFFFKADYVYCTLLVFLFMAGIRELLNRFDFLNPIETALSDFEMSDIVFARNIREEPGPDTSIVLVNIGNLSRRGIAREIEIIAEAGPKVLGIDCNFRNLRKPEDDSLLSAALSKVENLVLYSKLDYSARARGEEFDTLLYCHPRFAQYGVSGFCNLITPGAEEYLTCRTFKPVDSVQGHVERAFAVEVAAFAGPEKVERFLGRKKDVEIINFRGNTESFYCLDHHDLLGYDDGSGFLKQAELPVNLRDKIVIMGFMGESFGTPALLTREDKFHTPLNPSYAGKAYPDMFGMVVHANIVSMILNDTPVDSMGKWESYLLAILLCYLNVIFFFFIHEYYPSWYDLVVKTMQVVEVLLILGAAVMVYAFYSYSMQVTAAAIAVGLCGDVLEVYTGAMYNIVGRFRERAAGIFSRLRQKPPLLPTGEPHAGEPPEENPGGSDTECP
jgi:CHASE2 domain-containing sensor protein